MPGGVEIPHLRWPLRIADGQLQLVEQDTLEDVRQCVHLLLRTPLGARPLAPEVGIEDPTFTAGVDADVLAGRLEEMEDRARITVDTTGVDEHGRQRVRVYVALAEDDAQQEEAEA